MIIEDLQKFRGSDRCRRGHPKTPENTYTHGVTGVKTCKPCRWMVQKTSREREKKDELKAKERLEAMMKELV